MKKISIDDFELDLVSTIEAPIKIWGDLGTISVNLQLEELDDEVYEELSEEEEIRMFVDAFNSHLDRMQKDAEYIEQNKQKIIDFVIKKKIYDNLKECIQINNSDWIKFDEIYYLIDDDCGEYEISIYIKADNDDIDRRLAIINFDENMNMSFDGFIGEK